MSLWKQLAADLSAELGEPVGWCLAGFEVPAGGGVTHVSSAAVRAILGGAR